ncbi:MAG: CAP domain-containing protein [Ruminococcaceae bacterium]|nr:CAP domain-containing protein [Oscillospiraceae bacterium]
MSKKNIVTGIIAALALVLVAVVALVETGIISSDFLTEPETVIESEIVVVSETDEFGSVEYITMLTKYAKPKVSSNHRYPTKKTTTAATLPTTTTIRYVEQSSYHHVTDVNGIPQFNDDGSPVTEVIIYTVPEDSITQPTTAAPKTSAVAVTDASGNQQTDASGNPITEVITYTETTTKAPDIWSENTQEGTTGIFNIETSVKRDDKLAQTVVDQINIDRKAAGLEPLSHATGLKASARTNSMALALPDIYGSGQVSGAYTLVTPYGGNPIYQTVAAANKSKVMSADTKEIGIGIVVYEGKYYTTVLFG